MPAKVLGKCMAVASALVLLCTWAPMAAALDASRRPFRLLFSGQRDLFDPWGQLQISVTPMDWIHEPPPAEMNQLSRMGTSEPERRLVGAFPLADGSWQVYRQELTMLTTTWPGILRWRLVRGTTTDGVTFSSPEIVIPDTTGTWTKHLAMAYNPDAGEYLMLKLKIDPRGKSPNDSNGFAYHAWFSSNGRQWRKYSGTRRDGGLFYEGDAMTVFWSPVLKRFVLVSKSLQPWEKRIIDHGGTRRRVLMIRTSPDGRKWTPDGDLSNIFRLNPPSPSDSHPSKWYTVPDAEDPPDLEFYSGNAFWYHDRAYMMVLNYAPSRMFPRAHGEELDNEWWTSYDGLSWERPARGVNALTAFMAGHKRHDMGPVIMNGKLIWLHQGYPVGLLEDRISGVSARANGEFSTKLFTMPAGDLLLNVAVPSLDRPWLRRSPQPYVMVEVRDEKGAVIPGFERTKCVIWDKSEGPSRNTQVDQMGLLLLWNGVSARQLAGKAIRLRFYFSGSTIYAITSNAKPRNTISRFGPLARPTSSLGSRGLSLAAATIQEVGQPSKSTTSCQPSNFVN
jgi:hypothetical protein